jgi:glutamine synthetase
MTAKGRAREAGAMELVSFVVTDYAGITRGRSFPRSDYERAKGAMTCGWVPANMALTPFDLIADPNPWGSRGDLRLSPDTKARYRAWPAGAASAMDFVMSDIVELDGSPWVCCPRSFLKAALADFEDETGARVIAAFEQEFQILGTGWRQEPAFAYSAMRRADPFGPDLMAALEQAGVEPEGFFAEYGRDQFEITTAPSPGLVAADRCVAIREIVRDLARVRGWRATFAPKTAEPGVGNGVHIHMSFRDRKGASAAYDAKAPGNVSSLAGAFAAGILRHLPALVAFTAPSPVSYLRLQPHHWSASYTWFGAQDREASLRICPTYAAGGQSRARQFNLEYRAADAAASPHLALAMVVRAGLEGIGRKLKTPPLFSGDPALLGKNERKRLGLQRLPGSLPAALDALGADRTARGWLAPAALDTYVGMKRMELRLAGGLEGDALCKRYAEIY